ncbi:MAG: DUF4180 domain-containing protein [Hyphomonadaceae bacterium]
MSVSDIAGVRVYEVSPDGPLLESTRDATDLIGDAFSHDVRVIAIPASRFTDNFFTLRTRLLGEFVQKIVNYRYRLAILGDMSDRVAQSDALRDFVRESNRGTNVWFLEDRAALEAKLTSETTRA